MGRFVPVPARQTHPEPTGGWTRAPRNTGPRLTGTAHTRADIRACCATGSLPALPRPSGAQDAFRATAGHATPAKPRYCNRATQRERRARPPSAVAGYGRCPEFRRIWLLGTGSRNARSPVRPSPSRTRVFARSTGGRCSTVSAGCHKAVCRPETGRRSHGSRDPGPAGLAIKMWPQRRPPMQQPVPATLCGRGCRSTAGSMAPEARAGPARCGRMRRHCRTRATLRRDRARNLE